MAKRLFDIIVSSAGIIILFPVFIIIAVLFIFLSPGPVLFRQQRVGKGGKLFKLNKFRTMTVNKASQQGSFDVGSRSRITTLGSFLRKMKLDELPQLFNVLKGDMSLVGPRPEVLQWTKVYADQWQIVHQVRPGITDNASIEFRNEEEILAGSPDPMVTYRDIILPRKLELYIAYVQNHSLSGDIKILYLTFKAVLIH